jgi:hypothetical protein
MAKRKTSEVGNGEAPTNPDSAMQLPPVNMELPFVVAPSISPATTEPEPAPETGGDATCATAAASEISGAVEGREETPKIDLPKRPLYVLRPRQKRQALLAASVAIAAALGAIVGAAAAGGFSKPAVASIAGEENKATQQSVARLAGEITGLKASLEAASKSANGQIARITERLNCESADVTGSVAPPQNISPASQASAPLPRHDAQPVRPSVLARWSIRETRDGYVYVQGHGDVYQVVPGAPLPGLGRVEQIKRQNGRWMVVTPKGIIVSMRDRHYFEQF